MALHIYNTLTRKKEPFVPADPKNVRMYVCGPTVYDFAHIGNARPVIVFDVLFRLLRHLYGAEHVTYVRNITDVDDKINARALRDHPGVPLNDAIRRVTETTYEQFQKDSAALGCLLPTHQPRATEHIAGMVEMIRVLIKRGHAYEAAGEVLFDVGSMPDYGALSKRKLEEQQAGARVAVEAHKKNPADFVLWKLSSPEEPGWGSPWGRGRPGWHIECSVMSKAHLGEVFDIHGGGLDLIFPHHENEIAQSRCAHGTDVMAKYWMHNGFLQVEGQKMSKSLGNFVTISDLLETDKFGGRPWVGQVLRLAMLKTHYRQPIDWTVQSLQEATQEFRSYAEIVRDFSSHPSVDDGFISHLCDDLNTSDSLMRIRELRDSAKKGNVTDGRLLLGSLRLLGFFTDSYALKRTVSGYTDLSSYLELALNQLADDFIVDELVLRARDLFAGETSTNLEALSRFSRGLVIADVRSLRANFARCLMLEAARLEARKAKNWAESDRIRDELLGMGVVIKDNKDGTTSWEVKR